MIVIFTVAVLTGVDESEMAKTTAPTGAPTGTVTINVGEAVVTAHVVVSVPSAHDPFPGRGKS